MIARFITLFAVAITATSAAFAQGNNVRAIAVSPAQGDNIVRLNAAMEGDKLPFLCRERESVNLIAPIVSRAQEARVKGDSGKAQSLMEVAARLQGEICLRPASDDVVILRCKIDQVDGPGGSVSTVKVGAILRSDPAKVEQAFYAWTNASIDETGGGKCPGEAAGADYQTSQDILMRVQQRLFDFGHSIPEVDGKPNQETNNAIGLFQKSHGLPQGGLTKQTIERLFTTPAPTPWVTFAFDGFGNYAAATGGTRRNAEIGAIEQLQRRSRSQYKVSSTAAPNCMGFAVTRFTEGNRRSRRTFSQAFTHTGDSVDDAWKKTVDYCEREANGGECNIRYVLCATGEDIRSSTLRREDPESRDDRGSPPESRNRRDQRDRREGRRDGRDGSPPNREEGRRDGENREGRFDPRNKPINSPNPRFDPSSLPVNSPLPNSGLPRSDDAGPGNSGPEVKPGGPVRRFDPNDIPANSPAPR